MSGSTWTNAGSPTPNMSVGITGLAPGTPYDLDVLAENSQGSATSATITVTTASGMAPSQVSGLAAATASVSSIILSWAVATGTAPISYQPQFRVTGQAAWASFGSAISGSSETITGLSAGVSYDFQIIATNIVGSSTSGIVTAAVQSAGAAPAAPTGLIAGNATTMTIALSWAPSASGTAPISYQPQFRVAGQTAWTNFGSASAATSTVFTGLVAGSSYDFEIVAANAYGSAISSIVTASTAAPSGTVPSSPTNVTVTGLSPTGVSLSWSAATGTAPISYGVQYRVTGTVEWMLSGSSVLGLSATVSGLLPGATYDFQIIASNSAGATTSAITTVATPIAPSAPSAPGTPVAWIIMSNSVSLTWAVSTSGTAPILYQVQFRITGTSSWTLSGTASTATSTTVEGLISGNDYDFQVVASNTAGTSYSPILTILAPIPGGGSTVPQANYQSGQILTAEELDASFNTKLDTAGGAVGPLTITQTATGGSQPAMLGLIRTVGGAGDAPLISGSYTAVMSDGPVVAYSAVGMTVTVAGTNGVGPAGNVWALYGSLAVNALRSTAAPATGSKHAAVAAQAIRNLPAAGVPSGRRMADIAGVYAPVTDNSNLPSSMSGALVTHHGVAAVNGRDDADLRFGLRIVYGETLSVKAGGAPAEVSRVGYFGASTSTGYAKTIVELGGNFSVVGLDLRSASAYSSVISSSTPTSPVTALSVDRVLSFSAAGQPAMAVSSSNPMAVTINGNAYSVIGVSQTAGVNSGVLTFAAPVSIADATQGNTVVPVGAHTIWLSEGTGNALPGDIAFNRAGTSRIRYVTGVGLVIATGADVLSLQGTSAVTLPVGSTAQRPTGAFGMLRANSDTGQYELWQPSTSSWLQVGSTSATGGTGVVPGPALGVVAGTPSTAAISISWTAPNSGSTPFSYQVQYQVAGVSGWTNWGGPQSATSSTVSGLTANTRYNFQIITTNAYGSSTSASTSATTAAIAPAAPTGLTASNATSTTVGLSWTASASGSSPIGYLVNYRVTGTTPWTANPAGSTTGSSQTISGLSAATSYDFQVVASNAGGSATSSTATTSTSASATVAPAAPTAIAAGTPTSNSLVVSWTAPATGTTPFSYQVSYRVTGQTAWTAFGASLTATTETVTGLGASTSYDFEITATNSAGSTTSTVATAVTAAVSQPSSGTTSGSQTSGTTVPVITGPAAAAVYTGNVISLSGITIADLPAASASGSCKLSMSCTSGTLSTTVGQAQVAGSGSNSIVYSNTLASCQAAAADLVYTAGSVATSDNVVVSLGDQGGNSSSISIPVAVTVQSSGGGSSGSIPTDTTGTTAIQAQTVLNGFGVGTRVDLAGYQNLGLPTVENCFNYLGGVKLMRDSTTVASDATWFPQVSQATGATYVIYIAQMNASNFNTTFNNAGIPGAYIAAFEGCDEADTGQAVGYSETLADAAAFQPTVWAGGQSYTRPVIQMSFGQGWSTNPSQGDYGAVGNLAAYATYGNIHMYPPTSPQANFLLANYITLAGLATPSKPAAVTVFGYTQEVGSGYGQCSPQTAASYLLEFIFDAYLAGCPYYFWQSLIDNVAGGGSTATGLFDDTGAPRQSATAVKNLFGFLTDTGGTFTPGKLNYSLSNLPAVNGTTSLGGRQLLMQKSDGSFWLALWNEQILNSTTDGSDITVSPVSVTLTIGETVTSITVYDPTISAAVVETASSVSTMSISLPARVILVKIVK